MIGLQLIAVLLALSLGITMRWMIEFKTNIGKSSEYDAVGPAIIVMILSGGIVACLMPFLLR